MSSTTLHIPETLQQWQASFDTLEAQAGQSWGQLAPLKRAAMAEFLQQGFPTTKWEEWKYTSVRALSEGDYRSSGPAEVPASERENLLQRHGGVEMASHLVVLVNGRYDEGLSRILDDEVRVLPLRKAMQEGLADEHYGQVVPTKASPFVALNTAMNQDGVYLHLPANKTARYPVMIIHLGLASAISSHSRKLVVVGANAELKMVEHWAYARGVDAFDNHVSEIVVGDHARVELNSIQASPEAKLINFTQVQQGQGSHFKALTASLDGQLVRNDLQSLHLGEHCETHFFGLYLLKGQAHVDNHTLVDHAQPNCFSNELYKGVLDGQATAVFNGKVMVRPDAQKTNAFQSNKTILLSEGATINTKPQLEIFADDVKCSHGATTGRLDKTALFYLRSRGLSEAQARALLTYAFAGEVLDALTIPELKEHLTALVKARLFND